MLTYLNAIANSMSIEEVWRLHCEKMAEYEFDRIIYAYTRFRNGDALDARDDGLFLSNHDPDYIEGFIKSKLFLKAPVTLWAMANTGSCSWGDLWNSPDELTDAQRDVIAFNLSKDVVAGYSIRFADPNPRATGLMTLTARRGMSQQDVDELWAEYGTEIEVLNHMVNLRVLALPHNTMRGHLTDRQREVLSWIGDGKSNVDIATILGVSVATVEKHLRLARERLGVDTTAQAVLRASFQNQIFTL